MTSDQGGQPALYNLGMDGLTIAVLAALGGSLLTIIAQRFATTHTETTRITGRLFDERLSVFSEFGAATQVAFAAMGRLAEESVSYLEDIADIEAGGGGQEELAKCKGDWEANFTEMRTAIREDERRFDEARVKARIVGDDGVARAIDFSLERLKVLADETESLLRRDDEPIYALAQRYRRFEELVEKETKGVLNRVSDATRSTLSLKHIDARLDVLIGPALRVPRIGAALAQPRFEK